jgi:hypothetical protein
MMMIPHKKVIFDSDGIREVTAYRNNKSNTNFSNKMLAFFIWFIEVLHNSKNSFWSPEFQINQVLLYKKKVNVHCIRKCSWIV